MSTVCETRLAHAQKLLSELEPTQHSQRGIIAHLGGRWAMAAGDLGLAQELFNLALDELPALRPAIRGIQRVILLGGDQRSLLEWLDLHIRATSHPREAAALYRERGRLVEHIFQDLEATRQCHEAAILAAPSDISVLFSLYQTHAMVGDLDATSHTLQKIADCVEDDDYRAVLEHACSLIGLAGHAPQEEVLERLTWACRYAPHNPILAHDAYRAAQAFDDEQEMLKFLQVELEIRRREDAMGPALWRAAHLFHRRSLHQDALRLLAHACSVRPHKVHLAEQLYRWAQAHGDHPSCIQSAISRISLLAGAEETWQASAWYDLATTLLDRDRNDEDGLACLQKAIQLDPSHRVAGHRYLETLRDQGRYADFVLQAQRWSELGSTGAHPQERAMWLCQAASMTELHLEDKSKILELLVSAVIIDRDNVPANAALERIYLSRDHLDDLRDLYRRELERCQDKDRELLLRTLLCHVVPDRVDAQQAMEDNIALLKLAPECLATLQQLARLLSSSGNRQELLRVTIKEAELTGNARQKALLIAQAGNISRELLDVEAAKGYFAKALELDEFHDEARHALEAIARQTGDKRGLLDQLRAQLATNPASAGLRIEIADLLLQTGQTPQKALDVLEPLVQSGASSFSALRVGERNLDSLGQHAQMLEFIDRRVALIEGSRARAFWLLRSAWVRWRHLGEHGCALEDLWRAHLLEPSLHIARWMLFELLADQGSPRVWPWLRRKLQGPKGQAMTPMLVRWLVKKPPRAQVAEWLALDPTRSADGPTQCLDWMYPARTCAQPMVSARIAETYFERHGADHEDPRHQWLVYLTARSHALSRNWTRAQELALTLEDWELEHREVPGALLPHVPELSGKRRVNAVVAHLKNQRTEQRARAVRLHTSLWIIDVLAQSGQWQEAIRRCEQLITTTPAFLPAHYLYISCLEQQDDAQNELPLAQAYVALAKQHKNPELRASALRIAGKRFTQLAQQDPSHRNDAWVYCKEAFALEPQSDEGFRHLWECSVHLDHAGASQKIQEPVMTRLSLLREQNASDDDFVSLAYLSERLFSVSDAIKVIQSIVETRSQIPALHLLLARAQTRCAQWGQAAASVDAALEREHSGKRKGVLHFFLGDLRKQEGSKERAIEHYMQAAGLGYRVDAAGQAASQLAGEISRFELQVAALELLVDKGRRQDRARYMRELATLYRGPLEQPDRAIELISRLVASEPDDQDAVALLFGLLTNAQRNEEAQVTLRVATTRLQTKIRTRVAVSGDKLSLPIDSIHGLRRFFELDSETDGVYLTTAAIEIAAPSTLQGPSCDVLRSEPWPLPQLGSTALLPGLLREIPSAFLLRRLVHLWPHLPPLPSMCRDLAPAGKTLSPDRDASRVVHTLGALLGLSSIHVAVDLREEDQVRAHWDDNGVPTLILGRKVYTAPIAPRSRDAIGRALWRLATGGDNFRSTLDKRQRRAVALLPDLMDKRIILCNDDDSWIDRDFAQACLAVMPESLDYTPITDIRERSRPALVRSVMPLDFSLQAAEDRFGAICTADPRIALATRAKVAVKDPELYTDLIAYLLSNAHLDLRRQLGYQHLVELDDTDLEVLPL